MFAGTEYIKVELARLKTLNLSDNTLPNIGRRVLVIIHFSFARNTAIKNFCIKNHRF
jgi:hypothetical protein